MNNIYMFWNGLKKRNTHYIVQEPIMLMEIIYVDRTSDNEIKASAANYNKHLDVNKHL